MKVIAILLIVAGLVATVELVAGLTDSGVPIWGRPLVPAVARNCLGLGPVLVIAGALLLRRRGNWNLDVLTLLSPRSRAILGCVMIVIGLLPWNRMSGGRRGGEGDLLDTMMFLLLTVPGVVILWRGLGNRSKDENGADPPVKTRK